MARKSVLAGEVLAALMASRLAVRFLPFKRALAIGGRPVSRHGGEDMAAVWQIRRIVDRVGDRVPWRSVCMERGLAMQWLLRRRGFDARLHYGAKLDPATDLSAHVWVTVADTIVIGEEESRSYARVGTFP